MQLVRIAGSTEPMRLLGEVEGLDFERTSARRLADDRWQVAGYATEEALAELAARGLEVESVVEPGQLAEEREALFAQLDRERGREPGDGETGGA